VRRGAAYYRARLAGDRLRRCYALAPPRVRQYLEAEIAHVLERVRGAGLVLELGCGYGRVLARLAGAVRRVAGIDTSLESLAAARELTRQGNCHLAQMDATALGLRDAVFDAVVCVQNGISAFRVDPAALVREAVRVTRPGGRLLFSSYADAFWPERLDWFERQAAEGLVGEIDRSATTRGEIVCRDGFRFGTLGRGDFEELCDRVGVPHQIVEVDGSSLFCEMRAGAREAFPA
jgi:2-polyprenyl-6-hydroxyphenyl methylase/3-demethylubiquinone-9 3-methyltransferase